MSRVAITKCQAAGNDFILLDDTDSSHEDYPALARSLCDRRFGVGADGLLVLSAPTSTHADAAMRIFNADGSEAEMCGNGIRCLARYRYERVSGAARTGVVETNAGIIHTEIMESAPDFNVRVALGVPKAHDGATTLVDGRSTAAIDVDMGNPHVVAFVDGDLGAFDLVAFARAAARSGRYPDGVNVEIAAIQAGQIAMRVHERGVGETMACGTGACAVAIAAIVSGRATSPVAVTMPGGDVTVEWPGEGRPAMLTGGAELVFDAVVDVPDAQIAALK